jgi:hypothetical protein
MENWEKQFDEEFKWFHIHGSEMKTIDCPSLAKDLKNFIGNFIIPQIKKLEREKVIEMVRRAKDPYMVLPTEIRFVADLLTSSQSN